MACIDLVIVGRIGLPQLSRPTHDLSGQIVGLVAECAIGIRNSIDTVGSVVGCVSLVSGGAIKLCHLSSNPSTQIVSCDIHPSASKV